MSTLPEVDADRHRLLAETPRPAMAKAHLPKAETRDFRLDVGRAIQRARSVVGWSLKELAGKVGKEVRQVGRWESGEERPHVDALFALEEFRWPFIESLARLDEQAEIVTEIRRKA